jgi:hypothetical protein
MPDRNDIPLSKNLSLGFGGAEHVGTTFPTSRIPKGGVLYHEGMDLSEEGVGFGVPILKRGPEEFFPGGCSLSLEVRGTRAEAVADFTMNLVERVAVGRGESVKNALLYRAQHALASIHQSCPWSRPLLDFVSNRSRRLFGIRTVFEKVASAGRVSVRYVIDAGERSLRVTVRHYPASGLPCGELIVMNEQGAHHFDRYTDTSGELLERNRIESWKEITAGEATMASRRHGVAFTLKQVEGAKLFRGRECVETRFAWSGFAYAVPLPVSEFRYTLRIGAAE